MRRSAESQSGTEMKEEFEVFSDYLKKNGRKMTRQRQLVVECFLETGGHMSSDELYHLASKRDSKLGQTTVFRTLKALSECGLAREVVLHDGRTRFEHIYRRPHHHHIVCVECDRTIEFLSPEGERIQDEITSQYGFKPVSHNLQVFGVCPDCQKKKKTKSRVVDSDLIFARDALKIAMATERRGINFYKTASQIATDSSAKGTFLKMLEEEKDHLNRLQEQWDQLMEKDHRLLDAPVFLHFDYEALNRIFPSRTEARDQLEGNLKEVDALKLAMQMEKEAWQFFNQYAESFNDTRGRDIFLTFAAEEEEHYQLIKDEYDRLREKG